MTTTSSADSMQDKTPRDKEPLAIVGIGCRFPGGADSPVAFWELLCDGVDAIVDVPRDRWDVRRFYDPDPDKPGVTYTRQGGFLRERIDRFDAMFFGISPREAGCIDPQQRILLESVWEAFEDAGLPIDALAGTDTGVYIGGFTLDSQMLQFSPANRDLISSHSGTSASMVMLSNRISYCFDFRGPSVTIDTACSSSLVALNYACQDLWQRRCSLAVAGGVNVMLKPEYTVVMAKGTFLSPDAHCKAFDESANGYARGEGAGVVVLKPLAAALMDGDPVYAVIRGTGVNQDGRTNGITVPNGEAQSQLIRRVYREAGITPDDVSYIEAHGTGTAVGDPTEVKAFAAVLAEERTVPEPCLIGSLKANIGHLEAGAGIAGVIKAALCLKHGAIPPQIGVKTPNPKIPFAELGLRLPQGVEPLPRHRPGALACASINSFGYGGTNGHALLQEAPARPAPARLGLDDGRVHLLPLSARSPGALTALAKAYLDHIGSDLIEGDRVEPPPTPAELSHAMGVQRSHHSHRLAILCDSRAGVAAQLRAFLDGERSPDRVSGQARFGKDVKPVFVFTGMGPQWWGMGRQLHAEEPVFRAAVEEADAHFRRHAGWSILAEMLADESASRMASNEIAQPANFILQVGLAALWRSWGVEPAAIVGHSVGEVAAACIAGVLDLDSAARVSFHRSRLQQTMAGKGRMLAVGLPVSTAEDLLDVYEGRVSVAAINSPSAVTLAGDPDALAELAALLEEEGVFNRALRVEIAYHSVHMDPLKGELLASLGGLRPRAPAIPLYSTVTGELVDSPCHDADYWWRNVREAVRFADAATRLAEDGHGLFLEVGPNPVLAASIKECARTKGIAVEVVASLQRDRPERASMLMGLGGLYACGYAIDWKRLHPSGGPRIPLPRYPWQRETHWVESEQSRLDRVGPDRHVLLGIRVPAPVPAWEADVNANYLPYLPDHRIQGSLVFPGAGYVEAALAAQREVSPDRWGVVEAIEFHNALVIGSHEKPTLRTELDGRGRALTIHSRMAGGDGWRLHATARLSGAEPRTACGRIDLAALRRRFAPVEDVAAMYRQFDAQGMQYGPAFRAIRSLWLGERETLAEIAADPALPLDEEHTLLHPVLSDAGIQALIALMPTGAYVPVRIDRLSLLTRSGSRLWSHGRITAVAATTIDADITLTDDDGRVVAEIHGLRCQAISAKAEDADPLANRLYAYRWQEMVTPMDAEPASTAGRWLVFADTGGTGDALADRLAGDSASCIRVRRGTALRRTGPEELHLGSGEADMAALLRMAEAGSCAGIAYLWGLDADARCDDPMGLDVCEPALALVQALAQNRTDAALPRLFLVTRGVHDVTGAGQPISIGQSSLWGLGRVVISEHPELRCTLVDLGAGAEDDETSPAALARVMADDAQMEEIALRGPSRFFHTLDRVAHDDGGADEAVPMPATEPFMLEVAKAGMLDSLRFRQCERRAPEPGEVELNIRAAALNFKDVLKILGRMSDRLLDGTFFGTSIGMEAVATVTRVGDGVRDLKPGDRIVVSAGGGCLQPYVTLPVDRLFWLPALDGHEDVELAGMPVVFLTAIYGLRDVARLQPGERVLLHSACGGVGLAAIQVARWLGAEIIATAGSEDKRAYLRSLGIQHVMDSRSLDFADEVMAVTGGRGVDVVLNFLTGEALDKSLSVLAPFGRFVEIGKRDIDEDSPLHLRPFNRNLTFAAVDVDRLLADRPDVSRRLMRDIWDGMEKGYLHPLPTTVFPIAELGDACRLMMQAKHIGKIAVTFADQEVPVIPLRREEPLFDAEASYLITGGFGGFGLAVAKWMVEEGARNLVLVGRRGAATPEAQAVVQGLCAQGCRVMAAAVDIAQEKAVAALMERIDVEMPRLAGVLHAAMVLDDGLLVNLDRAQMARVMEPKALGAWHLHRHTLDRALDFFLLFSSVSALVGNPGQGAYVAANSFLDTLAHYRHGLGLPATSINWGVLAEVGVAARDADVERHLERVGMRGLKPRDAVTALGAMLRRKPVQIGVMDLDWQRWGQANPAAGHSPRFAELVRAGGTGDGRVNPLLQALAALAPEEHEATATALVAEEVAATLRMPADKLDVREPLNNMGLDSLIAIELQTAMHSKFGVEIPTLELMKGISVAQIARHILSKLCVEACAAQAPSNAPRKVSPNAAPQPAAAPAPRTLSEEKVL